MSEFEPSQHSFPEQGRATTADQWMKSPYPHGQTAEEQEVHPQKEAAGQLVSFPSPWTTAGLGAAAAAMDAAKRFEIHPLEVESTWEKRLVFGVHVALGIIAVHATAWCCTAVAASLREDLLRRRTRPAQPEKPRSKE